MHLLSVLWVISVGCARLYAKQDPLLREVRDQAMQLSPLTPQQKTRVAQQALYMMHVRKSLSFEIGNRVMMMTHRSHDTTRFMPLGKRESVLENRAPQE
jgi:hypothetical protein